MLKQNSPNSQQCRRGWECSRIPWESFLGKIWTILLDFQGNIKSYIPKNITSPIAMIHNFQ